MPRRDLAGDAERPRTSPQRGISALPGHGSSAAGRPASRSSSRWTRSCATAAPVVGVVDDRAGRRHAGPPRDRGAGGRLLPLIAAGRLPSPSGTPSRRWARTSRTCARAWFVTVTTGWSTARSSGGRTRSTPRSLACRVDRRRREPPHAGITVFLFPAPRRASRCRRTSASPAGSRARLSSTGSAFRRPHSWGGGRRLAGADRRARRRSVYRARGEVHRRLDDLLAELPRSRSRRPARLSGTGSLTGWPPSGTRALS